MKNYNDVTESVFKKSEEIIKNKKIKRRKYLTVTIAVLGVCVITAASVVFINSKKSAVDDSALYGADGAYSFEQSGNNDTSADKNITEKSSASHQANAETSRPTKKDGKKKVISGYEAGSAACYATPGNGEFFCSYPLNEAKKKYKDKVIYKVIIDIFSDSAFADEPVLANEKERLKQIGIYADFADHGGRRALTAEMSLSELDNFKPESTLGYLFFLYDESNTSMN